MSKRANTTVEKTIDKRIDKKPRSLEQTITQAWQQQSTWLYLLMPISLLYAAVTSSRRLLYQYQLLKSYRAPVPVMIIGNITVGGSGKTPLIISLVKQLHARNIKVGVISRGYGGDTTQMPALVTQDSLPQAVGDEPCLIAQSTLTQGVCTPISVCPNRQQAIELLLHNHPDIQLIISDDGLQHYKLQRDIEWVVVDESRGFGNKHLLPVGFLREPLSKLKNRTLIYNQATADATFDKYFDTNNQAMTTEQPLAMHFVADDVLAMSELLLDTLSETIKSTVNLTTDTTIAPNSAVFAVSGIGYPQRFFTTLSDLGYRVTPCPYPDHHDFSLGDLDYIAQQSAGMPVIITSKDAVKITQLFKQHITQEHYKKINSQKINNQKANNQTNNDIYRKQSLKNLLSRLYILPITTQLNTATMTAINTLIAEHLGDDTVSSMP